MSFIKEKTVAFIGVGSSGTLGDSPDKNLKNVFKTELTYIIQELYKDGKVSFLLRLKNEFEMLVAEEVLKFARKHRRVGLYIVSVYGNHEGYPGCDPKRYERVLEEIKVQWYIPEERFNDFLVENSSEVIVYGKDGDPNVACILDVAKRRGNETWNMYDILKDYFSNSCKVKEVLQDYPDVDSFKYGREGVIFRGYHQPFPVAFTEISKVEHENDMLCFTLKDGKEIKASLLSDDCYIKPAKA